MAGAPQFDLFSSVKGYEYALDQNAQDKDNAFKERQNEASLSAFEKQLREYEDGAPLRQQTQQINMLKGQLAQGGLSDQLGFDSARMKAIAAMSPEMQADTSPEGGLNQAHAVQQHFAQNNVNPKYIQALTPMINRAKYEALARAQYNAEDLNKVLAHPMFGNNKRIVVPIPGQPDRYEVKQRVEGGPGDNLPTYQPLPGSQGSLAEVSAALLSAHTTGVKPDYGVQFGQAVDKTEFARSLSAANLTASGQKTRMDGAIRSQNADTNQAKAEAAAKQAQAATVQAQARVVYGNVHAAAPVLNKLYDRQKMLLAQRAKLTKDADVRVVAALNADLSNVEAELAARNEANSRALASVPNPFQSYGEQQ